MISAARSNYQELAKLGQEHPQLVRLQVCVSFLPHFKTIRRIIQNVIKSVSKLRTSKNLTERNVEIETHT